MPNPLEVGTTIHLRGLTLRGKNRIMRGGHTWLVMDVRPYQTVTDRMLMMSVSKGEKETFWMDTSNDQHMQRLDGSEIGREK